MCYVSHCFSGDDFIMRSLVFEKRRKCDTSLFGGCVLKENFRTLILFIRIVKGGVTLVVSEQFGLCDQVVES